MAGEFRRGDSSTSVETTDSENKSDQEAEDDPMSAEEFEEFKSWLAADQPSETPRKPMREVR